MKYEYKVIATCHFDLIIEDKQKDTRVVFDSYNDDCINEHFYYGINSNIFENTYDTKLRFYFGSKNYYTLMHVQYSHNSKLMNEFKKLYNKEYFDLNSIMEIDGDCSDDIYEKIGIDKLNINKITLNFSLKEVDN